MGLETWNTLRIRQNPYLFLKIDEGLMKKMEVLWVKMEVLGEGEADKTKCVRVMQGRAKKFLKIVMDLTIFVQSTQFLRLEWVVSKLPKSLNKIFEKFV